jgi:hypothetical protein
MGQLQLKVQHPVIMNRLAPTDKRIFYGSKNGVKPSVARGARGKILIRAVAKQALLLK